MKSKDIIFKEQSLYNGRNGTATLTGINISDYSPKDKYITIYPINTKGVGYSTKFCIPKENIQELIDKLKEFL